MGTQGKMERVLLSLTHALVLHLLVQYQNLCTVLQAHYLITLSVRHLVAVLYPLNYNCFHLYKIA